MIYVKSVFDIKYLGGGYNLKETLDLIMYTLFLNAYDFKVFKYGYLE